MKKDISEILFDRRTIQSRVKQLGKEIGLDYYGKNPILLGVLNGAAVFLSDLIRAIKIPVEIDFIRASSYGNKEVSSGVVELTDGLKMDIHGREVILVEDIIDTGLTLSKLINHLRRLGPESLRVCALLSKPLARRSKARINYCGFEIDNQFVVGYGLDYAEKYRNLSYIGVLKKEVYSK